MTGNNLNIISITTMEDKVTIQKYIKQNIKLLIVYDCISQNTRFDGMCLVFPSTMGVILVGIQL